MSDNKKYYYLKLKEDFFDQDKIKYLDKNKKNKCIILYLKLLCKSDYYKRGFRIYKTFKHISLDWVIEKIFNVKYKHFIFLEKIKLLKIIDSNIIIKDVNVDINRNRSCKKYSEWRKAVFKRDNYTCQLCNKRGYKLNAHHKKSWKKYINKRFDIHNGITLCIKCHKNIHRNEK